LPPGDEPWSDTKVLKTMWPPQPGTKRLRAEFGARLVCVRYRRDLTSGHRYTTVEILVDHAPVRRPDDDHRRVEVRVHPRDEATRQRIKDCGGRWNGLTGKWQLTRKAALMLGLTPRGDALPAERDRKSKRVAGPPIR